MKNIFLKYNLDEIVVFIKYEFIDDFKEINVPNPLRVEKWLLV